jgi:NAD+ diphosphatase
MIGVHVKALSKELVIDKNEIADAKWISKEQMKAILAGDESFGIKIPNKIAIARNLLEYWVES